MKNIKKVLAVVLVAVICVFSASCATNSAMVISENGTVEVAEKIEMTADEFDKMDALAKMGEDKDDSFDSSDIVGINSVGEKTSEILKNSKTTSDVIKNFKKACKQEKRDNTTYYVFEDTTKFNSIDELNKIYNYNAKFTIGDAWVAMADKKTFSQSMAAYTLLGLKLTSSYTVKMPYKITKTNCEKVDDYTVKLNNYDISYVITEKSTSAWAKSADTINAIKDEVRKDIKPAKVTGVKVVYKDYKTARVYFKNLNRGQEVTYALERKEKGKKKWVEVNTALSSDKYIEDYLPNQKKTYSYRVRAAATSLALGDKDVYGDYSAVKTLKTTKFAKPAIKATSGKKSVKLSLTKKAQKLKGYQITYSAKSNFKGAKNVTVKKLPKTIKKLKSGKKYFVKVRQFTKQGKNKVFGPYSKKLSIKVK